jgi:glycosyltransferase involved in cell wall biosynthesis
MPTRPARGAPLPLTAIVLTLDEAANIRRCLECLARVEDVAILDSGSSDGTLDIARAARPDVRVYARPFTDFGDQRNYAIDHCSGRFDWILFVDADEFCTDPFLDEVAALVADPADKVGAFVAGRNYFLGTWLKHSTLFPSYQLRLLRRGHVRYRKEGHGQREMTDGPLHYFTEGWRHEGFSKGVAQWIDRHNRYSTEEIDLEWRLANEPLRLSEALSRDAIVRRRALKRLAARLPMRPLVQFLYLYVLRRGFLDGYAGLIYCVMMLAQQVLTQAKMVEARYLGRTPAPP